MLRVQPRNCRRSRIGSALARNYVLNPPEVIMVPGSTLRYDIAEVASSVGACCGQSLKKPDVPPAILMKMWFCADTSG